MKTTRRCQPVFGPILIATVIAVTAACARTSAPAPPAAAPPPTGAPATTLAAQAEEQAGTIRQVGTFGFGIVPDRDPGTRYAPDQLPEEFEVDGLRVVFSGRETEPPEGVRMWGTPFHLATIRRADR